MGTHDGSAASYRTLLARMPSVLRTLLEGLPDELLDADEGEGTWSPFLVVVHLAELERTNWGPRLAHVQRARTEPFPAFDREGGFAGARARPLGAWLDDLAQGRAANLAALACWGPADWARRVVHPQFGAVTGAQLVAAWAVHDQDHLAQVARLLAKRHAADVGPWRAYLRVLADRT